MIHAWLKGAKMVWVCEIKLSKNTAFLSKNTAFFVQKHCFFCPKTLPFLVQNTVFFYPKHFHSIRIFLSRSTSTHLLKLSAEGTDPQPPSGLPLRNQTHFLGNSGYYQARWQPAPLLTVSLTEEHSFL